MASQRAIAVHVDLTSARVKQLQDEGHITKGTDLDTARVEYIRFLRNAAATRHGGAAGDLQEERTRLTHHDANIKELKEREIRGELINAGDVARTWGDQIVAVKAKLLNLPLTLSPVLVACRSDEKAIHDKLVEGVREALDELSVADNE